MMTKTEIEEIISKISYKNWKFRLLTKGSPGDEGYLLQAMFNAPDIHTGKDELQLCRKFYVSPHACYSEVIRTAYLAIKQAEQHELDENFKYNEVAIFDPHVNLKRLSEFIEEIGIDEREPKPEKI